MDKKSARSRRLAGVVAAGTLMVLLAGCEDRMSDEFGYPRARPDRALATPPAVAQPRVLLPAAGRVAYRPDLYRSNCAPSRC